MGRGPFQKCQAFREKKKPDSFSSNQGFVLKFENFAVIRRMNYFCFTGVSFRCPGCKAFSVLATSQGTAKGRRG